MGYTRHVVAMAQDTARNCATGLSDCDEWMSKKVEVCLLQLVDALPWVMTLELLPNWGRYPWLQWYQQMNSDVPSIF